MTVDVHRQICLDSHGLRIGVKHYANYEHQFDHSQIIRELLYFVKDRIGARSCLIVITISVYILHCNVLPS